MTFDWAVRGWTGPGRAVTVGSGRQALGLLARWCRGNGIGTVLAPAFCCPTMVTPFWLEGMSVRFTAVDERLVMAAEPLRAARAGLDGPVAVLVARTGGSGPSAALRAELARMRRRGDLVIDDATHAVLADLADDERPGWCDASVASLRKLLPVPDGALLRAEDGVDVDPVGPATGGDPGRGPVSRRELPALFDAPHRPVPDGALAHLDALARAEARFDAALSPAPPCPATLRVLAGLDGAGLARRTAANSQTLARALAGSGVGTINPGAPPRCSSASGTPRRSTSSSPPAASSPPWTGPGRTRSTGPCGRRGCSPSTPAPSPAWRTPPPAPGSAGRPGSSAVPGPVANPPRTGPGSPCRTPPPQSPRSGAPRDGARLRHEPPGPVEREPVLPPGIHALPFSAWSTSSSGATST